MTTRPRPPSISSSVEGVPIVPPRRSEAPYHINGAYTPPGEGA